MQQEMGSQLFLAQPVGNQTLSNPPLLYQDQQVALSSNKCCLLFALQRINSFQIILKKLLTMIAGTFKEFKNER